jgi:phage terminase small subunit
MALTPKQERFVDEYLIDLNATQAAIRAGYSARTADRIGPELLGKTCVADAIAAGMAARAERTRITADRVLEHWWTVATADPNELVEFRRTCCRYCYGDGFGYQRTRVEIARDRAVWARRVEEEQRKPEPKDLGPFDPQGGDGYDARKSPNPECQVCFGDGVGVAYPKDTRTLSPAALRLYAGVKTTKDGLEVKMHDQAAALANVAKHLGMFVEKHEHTGKDGGPIETREAPAQSWRVGEREISWN